jgi:sucrose-6-phosphate hydrolase SacC (GH32 family)
VIVDQSIVEVFVNDGEAALTEQFFFNSKEIKIKSTGVKIEDVYVLRSIWKR